jgi:iron complex outermembrane recepter protein
MMQPMPPPFRLFVFAAMAGLVELPATAYAQRASENAVTEANDAFGTTVGAETSGIYTQNNTRGFSPRKAGNVRIEGIYFDQAGAISSRLQKSSAIRVGFGAEDFPFPAPTGVVDIRFYPMPRKFGASVGMHSTAHGGHIGEFDLRLPVVKDQVGLNIGTDYSDFRQSDGTGWITTDIAARAIIRFARTEFAPFIMMRWFPKYQGQTLVLVNDDFLPEHPKTGRLLGQRWAQSKFNAITGGATLKTRLTEHFVIRSGVFRAGGARVRNFTEIFALHERRGPDNASHLLISDPHQSVWSNSGEVQAVYLADNGKWHHRVYAGFRYRDRKNESGGSDIVNFGLTTYGIADPRPEQGFELSEINRGRIRQSAMMLGYIGRIDGRATINLGIQKSRFRATFRDGESGKLSNSRASPWLYNATIDINVLRTLSIYVGSQRGLEDSGNAPESAANRLAQLPTTKTTQYEGGIRWRFKGGQLFVNVFELTKPYFTFDASGFYSQLGTVRHRGVEASLSGQFGKRLHVVAGGVVMRPRVSGGPPGQGKMPTGTPSVYLRIDANYRTDIFGGLTPTATLEYTSRRAVGARALASLDGGQLTTPSFAILDLGLRQKLEIGSLPASLRMAVGNVFNTKRWDILAANTLQVGNRRRLTLTVTADF